MSHSKHHSKSHDGSPIAYAPSNIALIKYMGKDDSAANLPANGSLSLTLNGLRSFAQAIPSSSGAGRGEDQWIPELPRGLETLARSPGAMAAHSPLLSESGKARVLRHVERTRRLAREALARAGLEAQEPGALEIRTANTFPAASGIASSASSFAAITLSVARASMRDEGALERALDSNLELRRDLARISRQGSGSSCRSFEGPWVLWERESAGAIQTGMPALRDFVLVIGKAPKQVSSSEAHQLVMTSPLWGGRTERVAQRLSLLESALSEGDLAQVSRIAWMEMWEMHSLFHTCAQPFTYWEPGTVLALQWLAPFVRGEAPPIVTMDAGANVHVLVPEKHASEWRERLASFFTGIEILEDQQGVGAGFIGR